MTTSHLAHPSTLAAALGLALLACGGVKLGDRTLVAPVAPPALPERPAAPDVPEIGDAPDVTAGPDGLDVDDDHGPRASARLTASPEVLAARAATGCFVADHAPHDRTSPSDGPVDPWRAVDHGRPRVLPHVTGPYVDDNAARCDAARDHCLLDCGWLVVDHGPPYTALPHADERIATSDGFEDVRDDQDFVAYRSLPVTRRNLAVGALVLVTDDLPHPASMWALGQVAAIDWAREVLRLQGVRREYALANARVAVLTYQRGRQVEVVGGLRPDQLTIRPDELFLPRAGAGGNEGSGD